MPTAKQVLDRKAASSLAALPPTATALVTNSGTVIADGGTILLTASAVEGLVQNLVTAGGMEAGAVRHTCASEGSGPSIPSGARMRPPSSCGGRFGADASRCRCSWITPASANGEAVGTSVPLEMMKRTYAVLVADDSAK